MLPDAFRFGSILSIQHNSTILFPKSEVVVFSGFCLGRLRHSTSLEVTGIHYGDHLDPVIFDLWQLESAYWCFSASCLDMFSHMSYMSYMSYVNTQNPAVSKWTETALVRNVVRVDSYHLPEVFPCMICMALQLFANRNKKHGNTAAHIVFSTSVYKRASRFAISWMMCLDYLTTKSLICRFSILFSCCR